MSKKKRLAVYATLFALSFFVTILFLWAYTIFFQTSSIDVPKNSYAVSKKTLSEGQNTFTKKEKNKEENVSEKEKESSQPENVKRSLSAVNPVSTKLLKAYRSVKKVETTINFPKSFYTEKQIHRVLLSLKGCRSIPKANVRSCMRCHGEYGEKSAFGVSKPIVLMSAKQIYEDLKKYKSGKLNRYGKGDIMRKFLMGKDYSDCDLKSLSNQIKGL